ncbi:acetylcholine receptor-like protein cup-4 [Toxorhynchites rutilus septentrionalis]|uniref:acetylcholine receptor-like protein cup-4 n=1 Tax=Toxorhynchites rutilus septentrionalis TaxID=329112 RepID=UPI00247A2D8A|nr:acetylcholine receptor-like protein cup-4 [Toxorhynchites rutilus septentrionalis]
MRFVFLALYICVSIVPSYELPPRILVHGGSPVKLGEFGVFASSNKTKLFNLGSTESKYNVTYADLDKCKQFNAINGYNYHSFFKLEDLVNHNLDNETIVNLRLFVVAAKDAHILLSDIDSISSNAQVYEIVIGAGANTFSEIRKQRKKNPLKTKTTKNVLSPIDPLPLRIRITKDGLIEVGIEGQDLPLMSATDKNLTTVQYLSFSSWGATQAKWFYDCPSDTDLITQLGEYDPGDFPMTPREKLIFDLQMNASFDAPKVPTTVEMSKLVFTRVAYNSWKNTLETRFQVKLRWSDIRTTWNPQDYGNITKIIDFFYVWTPTLLAKNEAESQLTFLSASDYLVFTYDGFFEMASKEISTSTFCELKDSFKWPYETNYCELALSSEDAWTPLKMVLKEAILHPNMIQSDWNVISITKHERVNTQELYLHDDGSPRKEIILKLHLKRNNEFYETVLYAPYFMSNVLILVSFWLEGMLRIITNAFGILILVASFLQMSEFIPQTSSPLIFSFFSCTLYFGWICVVLFVLDEWLRVYGPKMAPDSWLARVISYPNLRTVLQLNGGSDYDTLHKKNLEWRDFVKVLDRIVFIIMTGVMVASCFSKI